MKYYWLSTGLMFLALSLMALAVWDMHFAAWFWSLLAGGKLTVFVLLEAEERTGKL